MGSRQDRKRLLMMSSRCVELTIRRRWDKTAIMNRLSKLKTSTNGKNPHQNPPSTTSASSTSSSTTPATSSAVGSSLWRPGSSATGLRRRRSASSLYLFAHPLSESLRTLDLLTVSRGIRDWRTLPGVKPCDDNEERVVERLLEMQRLQVRSPVLLTHWRPLLSYGCSYKASCARPG